jgi:DNA (cytosine-5)-methyltransferase 1
MKFIDLFAGTGAFSYALEKYGHEAVYANDMLPISKEIYELNHEIKLTLEDIMNVNVRDIPAHDLLCGGFPCQPFSIAGQQKGFDDTRANVFWKLLEIMEYHQPSVIFLENVKNLASHNEGHTFETILNELYKKGYKVRHEVLDTATTTGIPQHRERIYIVGFKEDDEYDNFQFDFPVRDINPIMPYLEANVAEKYYYTDKLKVYNDINAAITKHIRTNTVYQYRRHYVRENKSGCCPTLTANMGAGGHNVPLIKDDKGIRKLTPRECFNLQGFPSSYILPEVCDSKLYALAGNAVSIPVIEMIASKL